MRKHQTEKHHIHDAISSLVKAQEIMSTKLDRHEMILDSQAKEITELQNKVFELRNCAIKADLNSGLSGRDAALKYNLSPGRITQIKNQFGN